MMGHLLLLLVLATFNASTSAFSFLVLAPTVSPSHHVWITPVVKELLRRGHHVHYAGLYSINVQKEYIRNYTETVFEDVTEKLYSDDIPLPSTWYRYTVVYTMYFMYQLSGEMCKNGLNSQGTKNLLKVINNTEFNVIIQDATISECYYSLWEMAKGDPRIITYSPFSLIPYFKDIVGGLNYPQLRPYIHSPATPPFNIWQKMVNVFYHFLDDIIRNYYHMPRMHALAESYFHRKIRPLTELEKKTDVFLINTHPSIEPGIPLPPNAIEIGGLAAQVCKPVEDQKIKQFLDEATDGAVVVSLGTNVGWYAISNDKLNITVAALSKLKQRVLWKLEVDVPFDLPSNVMALKWIPQGDVMTHKNVKAAWTHFGLLSTQEAVWNGVPLIGMPFFMDQWPVMQLLSSKGAAVHLDFHTLSVKSILDAFNKVLYDPSYSTNMKKLSVQFRDRPVPPLDLAIWHIEHVARNPGSTVSWAGQHMNSIEYNLYDVYALFLTIIICFIYISRRIYSAFRMHFHFKFTKIGLKKLKNT